MTSFQLKLIALAAMTIDHIGTAFFPRQILFRIIGRLAFPLFGFLIAEGCRKTSNTKKYLFRLGAFAVISEIPFDLFRSGKLFDISTQNVFFTFFFAAAGIALYRRYAHKKWCCLIMSTSWALAGFARADYGVYGASLVGLLFIVNCANRLDHQCPRPYPPLIGLTAVIVALFAAVPFFASIQKGVPITPWTSLQLWAILAIPLIVAYNGQRGRDVRYLFYGFYPLHLLVLGIWRMCLS